jgi:glutamate racemase
MASRVTLGVSDMKRQSPIGIFDSGIGGLTVLKEVQRILPSESYIYVADKANCPFGDKSSDTILDINDHIIKFLISKDVKLIIIACNTSSAIALDHDRQAYSVPFVDMINDGLWFAKELPEKSRLGVIATQATVNAGIYTTTLKKYNDSLFVTEKACPTLVPLIEKYSLNEATDDLYPEVLKEVANYMASFEEDDYLVLGCSHYPYLKPYIRAVNSMIKILDPGEFVAKRLDDVLQEIGISEGQGDVRHFQSGKTNYFEEKK